MKNLQQTETSEYQVRCAYCETICMMSEINYADKDLSVEAKCAKCGSVNYFLSFNDLLIEASKTL